MIFSIKKYLYFAIFCAMICVNLSLQAEETFTETMNRKSYEAVTKKKCPPISNKELNQIKCVTGTNKVNSTKDIDELSEYLIFSDIAQKESERLECLSYSTEKIIKNENLKASAVHSTCDKLEKLKLAFDKQRETKKSIKSYESLNDRMVRNIPDIEFNKNLKILENLKAELNHAEKEIQIIQTTDSLLNSARIFESVSDWLHGGLLSNGKTSSETCGLLKSKLNSLLNADLKDQQSTHATIQNKLKDKKSWLSDTSFKRELWSTDHTLNLPESTICRINSRYGEGADHWDHLFNIWLMGGSVVGGQAIKLAAFTFPNKATLAYKATRLAMVAEAATNIGISTAQALDACNDKLKILTDKKSCTKLSDSEFENLFSKQQDADSCLFFKSMALLNGVVSIVGLKTMPTATQTLPRSALREETRRATTTDIAGTAPTRTELYGTRLQKVVLPGLPKSVGIVEYQRADGTKYLMYEKTFTNSEGQILYSSRELPIDKLTGAIDANYPAGRDLLKTTLQENQGPSFFTFIDVNNLGYINKNFAKGSVAGDEYLKNVADAITKASAGKAQLYKLGGDEFGLVIHEADPEKSQAILNEIIKTVYGKNTHQTFTDQKKILAEMYKQGVLSSKELHQKVGYMKEGISAGSARPGLNEDFESISSRAQEQARLMKVETKFNLNTDATKAKGLPYDESKVSNQRYVPKAMPVESGTDITTSTATTYEKLPSLELATPAAVDERQNLLYRFGNTSVIKYKNALGEDILRYEKYLPTGSEDKQLVTGELFVHQNSGFIDGSGEQGKALLNQFISSSAAERPKTALWINAENLGKINYFENGTQAGDQYLKATSLVIERELASSGIPFKMQGSEFIVGITQGNKQQIAAIENTIRKALKNDPKIQKVFLDQKRYLNKQLALAQSAQDRHAIKLKIAELKEITSKFTIKSTPLSAKDDINSVLSRTKGP